MSKTLIGPDEIQIDYLGLGPEAGPLPAFFYFALSGAESLELPPYCQPAQLIAESNLRVFSFTLPGHEAGLNKLHAMRFWAESMEKGQYLLENFFEKTTQAIQWLIEQQIVEPNKVAIGGLSRGGFVATHLAAKLPFVHTLLGFAPVTELMQIEDFASKPGIQRQADALDLIHLVDHLTHVRHLRFYIGNLDTRVNTDACYRFIRHLAQTGHAKHARHQKIELMITHSIGYKGHGTEPHIFEEGATWVKHLLLGS